MREKQTTSVHPCSPRPMTMTTGGLSFGASDTGPLPHWTEPPTGEMPRTLISTSSPDSTDDLDVWSSFAGKAPVWRDDSSGRPTR